MLRVGTRGSRLALKQAEIVRLKFLEVSPHIDVRVSVIKTSGDKLLSSPLAEIGGKGVFVKEIEESLLNNEIDIAVHSLKDVPSVLPDGLIIGAVFERQYPEDAVVSKKNCSLEDLIHGSRVGTGSMRREVQILHYYPQLEIVPIRGNVDTRIKKLETENLDAVVLASAGLHRMGFESKICQVLDPHNFVPAPGQGIIAIESRKNDDPTNALLKEINHLKTLSESLLERSFLKRLEGSCNIPAGCYARISGDSISAVGFISERSGKKFIRKEIKGDKQNAEYLGAKLADQIIANAGV